MSNTLFSWVNSLAVSSHLRKKTTLTRKKTTLPPPPPSSNYPGVSLSEEGMVRNVVAAQVNLLVNKKISGLKLKHLLSKHIDLDKYPLNLILSAM